MVVRIHLIRLPVDFALKLARQLLPVPLVALLMVVALGVTWGGLMSVSYRELMLVTLALLIGVWSLVRWRRRWQWHRTALDVVVGLWGFAFGLSLLANLDAWRRISFGLWFSGLYILIWYILHDWISNHDLKRSTLIDGTLIAGTAVLVVGYWQAIQWFDAGNRELPRVAVNGNLDNPNPLATVMLTLLPLAIARLFTVRGWQTRAVFAVYSVLTGGMIILTGTRGAWIGAGVALALLVYLLIRHYRIPINRTILGGLGGLAVIGAVAVSLTRGWDTSGRTTIYEAAIQMFREKPVTGYGLFTFGRGLLRLVGIVPETTTHAQAHDIFLNIAAELGIVGLVALFATLAALVLAARRNWIAAGERNLREDRILIAGAVAASIGFGVHHVFDITAMLPAVTLVGLVALVIAIAPVAPLPVQRPHLRSVLLGGLVLILLPAGVWETATYSIYMDGVTRATHGDLNGAIQQMQAARDADPNMPVTLANLAFLQDMRGQHEEARKSVAALCRLEPYYAAAPFDASLSVLQFFRLSLLTTYQFWYTYSESPCAIRTTYGSLSK